MSLGKKKMLSQGAAGGVVATDNFNTVLYTGNGGTQAITGVGFQPDFVWIKNRDATPDHVLFDSIRGVQKFLRSNNTDNEGTATDMLSSFDSNGFTVGNATNTGSSADFVAWCWYAPTSESIGASGSRVASTVKKNVAAGFSIVTFTCPSSNQNFQIGHGLGVKPDMVIMKKRNATGRWLTWHKDLSAEINMLFLDENFGEAGITQDDRIWGQQSFTDTTISSSTGYSYDANDTVVAYCFANIAGYQKIGSYTGNRPSNVTVTTGFQPRFVMIKADANGEDWTIVDSTRGNFSLYPNSSAIEDAYTGVTFNSTGFVVGDSGLVNTSGANHIYLAIA